MSGVIQKLGVIQSLPLTESTSKSCQCSLQNPHQLHLRLSITTAMPSSGLDNCNNFPVGFPLPLLLRSSQARLQDHSPFCISLSFSKHKLHNVTSLLQPSNDFPRFLDEIYTLCGQEGQTHLLHYLIMPIPARFKH